MKMKRSRFARGDKPTEIPLLGPLFDDLVECEGLLDSGTQFACRTFIRAAFAFNEGYLNWLRRRVAQWWRDKTCTKDSEIIGLFLLGDRAYSPNRQGKVEPQRNCMPFLNRCAFVLRSGAERWNLDPTTFFSDNGWNEMQAALRVRHRITHPDKPEDLSITEEELRSTSEGVRWLLCCTAKIVDSIPQQTPVE